MSDAVVVLRHSIQLRKIGHVVSSLTMTTTPMTTQMTMIATAKPSRRPLCVVLPMMLVLVLTLASLTTTVNGLSLHDPSTTLSRRQALLLSTASSTAAFIGTSFAVSPPTASAKCTDIESCREIGDRKIEVDAKENPTIRLDNVLKGGVGRETLKDDATVDLIYSISTSGGAYMYSRGFGYNKIDVGNGQQLPDTAGLDSYKIALGKKRLPDGVEAAMIGMKKGERRRMQIPASVGFETSGWQPEPTNRRGKAQIVGYQNILRGNGDTQPPFPASTIWEVEVLKFNNK